MTRPLPPKVHGPITPESPSVKVTLVAKNATVDIFVGGVSIGSTTSSDGGTIWVKLTGAVAPKQEVKARQKTAGGTSDDSVYSVTVSDVPDPLPTPVFVSPLSTCMSRLKLDGLVPGATVLVRQEGKLVGENVVSWTNDSVDIFHNARLTTTTLQAIQRIGGSVNLVSEEASSLQIQNTNDKPLPPPGISQPVIACMTSLDFFGMTPSAEVEVDNEGTPMSWTNVGSAYNGWNAPPFKQGKLVAKQQFPRCNIVSSETEVQVGPPEKPGPPTIQSHPCVKLRTVNLTGLITGAVVEISTVVPDTNNPGKMVITPIGEAVASSTSEDFDLPLGINPVTTTGDAVRLTFRQTLCGLQSDYSSWVNFDTPSGPFEVKITLPIYECSRKISVTGACFGALLQPFYDNGDPIGDIVYATDSTVVLNLWFPLVKDHNVKVKQIGCNADGESFESVKSLPNPLPVPQIVQPVRPHASSVKVSGCIPGARIHLLVNNVVRKSIDTLDSNSLIPTADLELAENEALWVVQTLCTKQSSLEGQQTIVKKGNMVVSVQPNNPIDRGTTVAVTVNAKDTDTSEPIIGAGSQVLLDGKLVGQAGIPFTFSPVIGQPNPVGLVKETVAHNDVSFTITLKDPPPKPKNKLYLNISPTEPIRDTLKLIAANWTVTTAWAPVQTLKANGANAYVTLPDPPPSPANQYVSVVLETSWELYGEVNNEAVFPDQMISGHMDQNPLKIALTGKDITAGWFAQWNMQEDANGFYQMLVVTRSMGIQ
ncbi:hypothetical protein KQ3_04917 [Bacillus cereus B5-2]|nr:hypothetical protein KQ3_04917 [Bacillus cereus B5-2]